MSRQPIASARRRVAVTPRRAVLLLVTALLLTPALVLSASPAASGGRGTSPWSPTWAAAVQQPFEADWTGPNWSLEGFDGQSLRQIVRVSGGGDLVRINVSNAYGQTPLTLTRATIGRSDVNGVIAPGTLRTLTFRRSVSTVVPAGAETVSDAAVLAVSDLDRLAVTFYFADPTGPATFHSYANATTYRADGDHTRDSGTSAFTESSGSFYYLSRVDVTGHDAFARDTIVALGDSITDGVGSTIDADNRYPDQLAERIVAADLPYGVLNAGISGNQVLLDTECCGESALNRFERDVLSEPNVRTVIVLEGVNDIGTGAIFGDPVTAEEVIAGYRALIDAAHARGIRVIGATITQVGGSFYDVPGVEEVRDAVNEWIRTSGAFDEVADFDAALADPADPDRMRAEYSSGDWLHPGDAGLDAMARAVDLADL